MSDTEDAEYLAERRRPTPQRDTFRFYYRTFVALTLTIVAGLLVSVVRFGIQSAVEFATIEGQLNGLNMSVAGLAQMKTDIANNKADIAANKTDLSALKIDMIETQRRLDLQENNRSLRQ